MTCSICGSELQEHARFCNFCGASIHIRRELPRYAGFWRRALAVLIDLVLLAPAIWIFASWLIRWPSEEDWQALDAANDWFSTDWWATYLRIQLWIAGIIDVVFCVCAPYYILTESSALQGTVGKRILGLRVSDLNGKRIRLGRAIGRYLARVLSAIPWQMGFVMAGFTPRKRALHDFVAGTLVTMAGRQTEQEAGASDPLCKSCLRPIPKEAAFCSWCGKGAPPPNRPLRYAGFGRRALALFLDFVILLPLIAIPMNRLVDLSPSERQEILALNAHRLTDAEMAHATKLVTGWVVKFFVVLFLFYGSYFALTEGSPLQGTFGKRFTGLMVTDQDGRAIRPGRAIVRSFVRIISILPSCAGYFMAAFTAKKQALHDFVAGTVVVIADKAAGRGQD
jgi:uncharacterized RDD family membrane protein YckC